MSRHSLNICMNASTQALLIELMEDEQALAMTEEMVKACESEVGNLERRVSELKAAMTMWSERLQADYRMTT